MATLVNKGTVIENSATILLARVAGANGVPVVQADIDSMLLKVYDNDTGSLITPSGGGGGYAGTELNVVACIHDTPVTSDDDARWPYDDGFNVEIEMDGSFFPVGGKTYQAEVKVTPSDGDAYYLLWQLKTVNIFSE